MCSGFALGGEPLVEAIKKLYHNNRRTAEIIFWAVLILFAATPLVLLHFKYYN